MIDFENEGLYITEEGYFVSKWNSDTRKYNAYSLNHDEIPFHLNNQVFITDKIRLKHIFEPLLDLPIFEIIFHTDWWKEIVKELKSKEWKPWIGDTKLKKDINIPSSIKDMGIAEKDFMAKLDTLVEQAFDDQCTGANPAYPLMEEIKQIYIKAYKGVI